MLRNIPAVFNLLNFSLKAIILIIVPKTTIDMLFTGKKVEAFKKLLSRDFITKNIEKKLGIPKTKPVIILLVCQMVFFIINSDKNEKVPPIAANINAVESIYSLLI